MTIGNEQVDQSLRQNTRLEYKVCGHGRGLDAYHEEKGNLAKEQGVGPIPGMLEEIWLNVG